MRQSGTTGRRGCDHRLRGLQPWIPHLKEIGCNAVYLGPVFSSVSHGYDTTSYTEVDPPAR